MPGGYNGGGSVTGNSGVNHITASGGGATHIAKVTGLLSTLEDNIDSILIVAGAGGGARNQANHVTAARWGNGGSGGGYIGGGAVSNFNTTTTGYHISTINAGTQISGYAFGMGESVSSNSGGGAGYYGGFGGSTAESYNGLALEYAGSGSGGSGYIGNTLLTNKVMYGYNVATSSEYSTKTVSTTAYSSNAISYYAKAGNGAAAITYIPAKSEDNYLSSLTSNVGTFTEEFDPATENYTLVLDDETEIKLTGTVSDENSVVTGLGEYSITSKETTIEITVTAENGDVRTYTVNVIRKGSPESRANNITINGLIEEYCKLNEEYGVLKPESFDPNTNTYSMLIPYKIKQLSFVVDKMNQYATVEGDGNYYLTEENNVIEITITSDSGENTTTYTYNITRDVSGDADLKTLEVLNPAIDIGFETDKTDYRIAVSNDCTSLDLNIETDDESATYVVTGNENFEVGDNTVTIVVTARNGDTKTYTLNVYRENTSNVYLQSLNVKYGEVNYTLTPEFNKLTWNYKLSVPNEVTSVTIEAEPEDETAQVTGIGSFDLSVGNNNATIKVIALDGNEQEYTVTINRAKNSNCNLSNIQIFDEDDKEYELTTEFSADTLSYMTMYNCNDATVNIVGAPEVATTTVKLLDGATVKNGSNIKRVMAIAEDGTSKTYTVNVYKTNVDENNYLSDIQITFDGDYRVVPEFDKETQEYNVILPRYYFYKNISIKGITESAKATIEGNGTFSYGNNVNTVNDDPTYTDYPDVKEVTLTVTAESGDTRAYVLKVYQEVNSDAYLQGLEVSKGTLTPNFDKDVFSYTVNVDNSVEEIDVAAIPLYLGTSVEGDGVTKLSTGENIIELVSTSEDKTQTLTYTIKVNREKSNNNNIENLVLKGGKLTPTFETSETNYTAVVPNEIRTADFIVELEDETATYEILNSYLQVGENTVTIRVTAENGDTKDYTVNITRQAEANESNYLLLIETSKGTLSPEFNKTTLYYEVEVPMSISQIDVTAVKEDALATLVGDGTYNLEVGQNYIYLEVTSTDGYVRTYELCVTRANSDESRLSKLDVDNTIMTPSFDKDTYEYSLTTTEKELTFNSIVPVNEDATYEIIGNSFEETGTYDVTIKVTAPDKTTTSEYVLHVTRNASNNNNLASLVVYGYEISPVFSGTTTVYSLTVDSDVQSVVIGATAEDTSATVEGTGEMTLTTGVNTAKVIVTSELGNQKAYTIAITRKGSSNNLIKSLEVNNGTLNEEFESSVNNYTVNIPYEVDSLDLSIVLDDNTATYEVIGNENLAVGENVVKIAVTAGDGNVNTYVLNVERAQINSAYLESISVANYDITPEFNKYINNYSVTINYNTTELDLTALPEDENATVTITGNENFVVGTNTVTITVVSSNGDLTETYEIEVERQEDENSYLEYLYTDVGTMTPTFDKDTYRYTIDVENSVEEIEVFAKAMVSNATVTGTGMHSLELGENKIEVKVTTANGIESSYIITVNRAKRTDNYLLSLDATTESTTHTLISGQDEETGENITGFDKTVNEYTIYVSNTTNYINLTGRISDGATVEGLGEYSIPDEENTLTITVTSEAGENNVYTINVIKELDTNNYLTSLVPSSGEFTSEFMYEDTEYYLNLGADVSELSFEVETESLYATVTGNESQTVPDGESTRTITVTAQNGDTRAYTIYISKEVINNSYLSSLEVTGYELEPVFNKETYAYEITVPYEKTTLLASEVIAKAEDEKATIQKTSSLTLSTTSDNKFVVIVTAQDGFTTSQYTVNVIREKNSDSKLVNLEPTTGRFTENFIQTVTEYEWKVPKSTTTVTKDMLEYELSDTNASVEISGSVDMKDETAEKKMTVTVTSENGLEQTTYTLNISYDEAEDATLKELNVDTGTLTPEFESETYEYTLYVYADTEKITVDAIPTVESSTVIAGNGEVTLTDTLTKHTITVQSSGGSTENYVVNIYRTIQTDKGLKNIYLADIDNLEYNNGQCTVVPEFETDTYNYTINVPQSLETLNLVAVKSNGQQSVACKVNDEVVDSTNYDLTEDNTIFTFEVYDGFNALTSTYTVEVIKDYEYTITYYYGTTQLVGLEPTSYICGTGTSIPEYNKEGYTFCGWYQEITLETKVESITADDVGNKTLYAKMIESDASLSGIEYSFFTLNEDGTMPTLEYAELDLSSMESDSTNDVSKYKLELNENLDSISLKVSAIGENSTVEVDGEIIDTSDTTEIKLNDLGATDTVINIVVTAEDGSIHTYEITVHRAYGTIKGSVKVAVEENFNNAEMYIYKQEEIEKYFTWEEKITEFESKYNDNLNEELHQIQEEKHIQIGVDGNYEVSLSTGTYSILIDKMGYLDQIYINVTIKDGETIELGEVELIAGDINKDGIIQTKDKVKITSSNGMTNTNPDYSESCDLNGDGIIQTKDKVIVMSNNGKTRQIMSFASNNIN